MRLTTVAASAVLATSALCAPSLEPRLFKELFNKNNNNNKLPGGTRVKEPNYFTSAFSTRAGGFPLQDW